MDYNSDTASSDKIIELLDIKKQFINHEDIDEAVSNIMQSTLDFFRLDRIYIGGKSSIQKKCVPIIEYFENNITNLLGDIVNFNDFSQYINIGIDNQEQEFMDLIDENNYYTEENSDIIMSHLEKMGYVKNKEGIPNEYLIFCVNNKHKFSFIIMERCKDRGRKLYKSEQLAIASICDLVAMRVEKDSLIECAYNEVYMKDTFFDKESMPVCVVSKVDRKVIYFNEYYKKFIPEVCIGADYDNLFNNNKLFQNKKKKNIDLVSDSETLMHHKYKRDGEEFNAYWIKKVNSMVLADGKEAFMIYIKDTADYIRQLEGVDLLTSAYSIKGFINYYEKDLKEHTSKNYFLCTFDVAKFKYINDSKGFDVGNRLLKEISNVLTSFVKHKEAFCRMNEDKFALLLQHDNKNEITMRIKELFEHLEVMRSKNFSAIGVNYACGILNLDKSIDLMSLIDKANIARRTAKGSLESSIAFFDDKMEDKLNNETVIVSRVSKAVEDGEFVPYLQPKFDLKTMKICGAEALVRWITPTGMIFPDSFIPLFEKNGFITTLDFIIYRRVMEHIRNCIDRNVPVYPISLNVSRNHMHNRNFVNEVIELVEEFQIPIELLEFEITESVFVEDTEVLKLFVDNIKARNFKVSIDDFGSAYSSLQTLKDIDIDVLKIDKGFIDNMDHDDIKSMTKDKAVLKNIINLARDLDCKVVCEGIETENQIEMLKSIGCETGQGYVFARPMPMADYEKQFLI